MRAVNLLPPTEQKARFQAGRAPLLVAAGGFAAVTTGAVLLALSASGTADQRRGELESIDTLIASLPTPPQAAVSQPVLLSERTSRTAALTAALSSRTSFAKLLREVSFVLPEDTWLTGFKAAAPASVTPGAPVSGAAPPPPLSTTTASAVTIQGSTYSHDSVARVLTRLSALPSLENVLLTGSARVEEAAPGTTPDTARPKPGRQVVTFTISASLAARSTS